MIADLFDGQLDAEKLVQAIRTENYTELETVRHNFALAYLELIRCGREPRACMPHREERPASPRELLVEAIAAADRGDSEGYARAVNDLAELANWGDRLTTKALNGE